MPNPRAQFKIWIDQLESTSSRFMLNQKIMKIFDTLKSEEQLALLGFACHKGLFDAVKHILTHHPDLINAQTNAYSYFKSIQFEYNLEYKSLPPLLAAMLNRHHSKYKLIDWLLTQPALNIHEKGSGRWNIHSIFYIASAPSCCSRKKGNAHQKELAIFENLIKAGLELIPSQSTPTTLLMSLLEEDRFDYFKIAFKKPLNWQMASSKTKKEFEESLELWYELTEDITREDLNRVQKEIIQGLIQQDFSSDFKIKKRLERWCPEEIALFEREKMNQALPQASQDKKTLPNRL